MANIIGDARGQLEPGTLVRHPGTRLWLKVTHSYLSHGGWAEVDAIQAGGMHAGRPWVATRIDWTDGSVPYVVTAD